VFLALVLPALATAAAARELGTAPQLRILGFSADGRHFGFEQEGGDGPASAAPLPSMWSTGRPACPRRVFRAASHNCPG
ncbi:hypothetical protein, partial [Escherichia coli]|uniref:hypothetical protein n=1 Tax=Escherichia coli TaxID=562 RepID=UPI0019548E05